MAGITDKDFILDKRLEGDTVELCEKPLCKVLLMNDSRYPWLVLVPKVQGATEVHHLGGEAQLILMKEITDISNKLETIFEPDKVNVGALGNIVSQLHVHIICRYKSDETWPGPVWGVGEGVPYSCDELKKILNLLEALC